MKIAFVTHEYPPNIYGGAGMYSKNIVHDLAELGHDVTVFTPLREGIEDEFVRTPHIRVITVEMIDLPLPVLQFWIKLRGAIHKDERENGRFDIVHFNSYSHFFLFGHKITRAPQILTIHHMVGDAVDCNSTNLYRRLISFYNEDWLPVKWAERSCVKMADRIVVVSDFTKRRLAYYYPFAEKKTVRVYSGFDGDVPYDEGRFQKMKERFDLGSEKLLLSVGRVNDARKGFDVLVEAFSMLPEDDDCRLIIVGRGEGQPLKALAERLGVADRLVLTGYIENEDLWALYHLCDLCVVSSRLEGFGLAVLDGGAAGKKVVATNVGAIPEIGGPGVSLVDPDDPRQMAEAIHSMLREKDPPPEELKAHLSKFSWPMMASGIDIVYREELERMAARRRRSESK